MQKKYNTPTLTIVSVNKKDIIATSNVAASIVGNTDFQLAPSERGFDDWDAGY